MLAFVAFGVCEVPIMKVSFGGLESYEAGSESEVRLDG